MRIYRIGTLLCSLGLAGCSVHPLPEQVAGLDTIQIVAKVRCEVRDGLRRYVIGYLTHRDTVTYYPRAPEVAAILRADPAQWRNLVYLLKTHGLDPERNVIFKRYRNGAVAYEFLFNITENNSQAASVDFLRTITNGALTGGISAGNSLDRNNIRDLSIADDFERLTTEFGAEYCGPGIDSVTQPEIRESPNIEYPIAGGLGLVELVGAFFNLNQSGNLVGLPNAPAQAAELPTISETLKFTTTVTGGGTFGFANATPARPGFQLAKASAASANSRADVHTLRIVIKLPPPNFERTRTIAEQRLLTLGVVIPADAKPGSLVKANALVDLSLAPGKEYEETKILVGQSLTALLPN